LQSVFGQLNTPFVPFNNFFCFEDDEDDEEEEEDDDDEEEEDFLRNIFEKMEGEEEE
jgi:hypothetical protein